MFHFFVCINLITVFVSCQPTEDISTFINDVDTSQSWQQETTEQPLELDTNIDTTQSWEKITTGVPLELSTNNGSTQTWENFTTDETSKERNFTTTTISSANGYLRENRSLRILMISLLIIVYSDFMFFFEKNVF